MSKLSDDELSQGTFKCDVCGIDTPHHHNDKLAEQERLIRPAFEKTTVPRGWFNREFANGPYLDKNTEALWQHFYSGWVAAKRVYAIPAERRAAVSDRDGWVYDPDRAIENARLKTRIAELEEERLRERPNEKVHP